MAVHPGLTYTDEDGHRRLERLMQRQGISEEEARTRIFETNHLHNTMYATDVANVIVFLASPKGRAVNGDVVGAGGGVGTAIYY